MEGCIGVLLACPENGAENPCCAIAKACNIIDAKLLHRVLVGPILQMSTWIVNFVL